MYLIHQKLFNIFILCQLNTHIFWSFSPPLLSYLLPAAPEAPHSNESFFHCRTFCPVFWILWIIGIARMTTGVWQLARGYPSNDRLSIALWWRGDGTILAPSVFAQVLSMW